MRMGGGVQIAVQGVNTLMVSALLMHMANSVFQVEQYVDAIYFYEEAIQVKILGVDGEFRSWGSRAQQYFRILVIPPTKSFRLQSKRFNFV